MDSLTLTPCVHSNSVVGLSPLPRMRPRPLLILAGLSLLALTGCGDDESIAGTIVAEILTSQIHVFLAHSLFLCFVGAVLGAIFGVVLFGVGGYFQLFRWEWKHAWVFRWVAGFLFFVAGGLWGGAFGGLIGVERGAETILRKSQLSRDVFPIVGVECSSLVARFYLSSQVDIERTEEAIAFRLGEYREGEWEIDIDDLNVCLQGLNDSVVQESTAQIKSTFKKTSPQLAGTYTEVILFKCADVIGAYVLKTEARKQLKKLGFGADKIFEDLFNRLPEAAASSGDPKKLSCKELSDHFIQVAFVPVFMIPIKHVVKTQKVVVTGLFVLFCLLSMGFFWIAEFARERWFA